MPFNPVAIAKRIRKAQKEIAKGLSSNEEETVTEVLDFLKKFQKELRAALGGIEADTFNATHLKRISDLIDQAIDDFKNRAAQAVGKGSSFAAKSGQKLWGETTAAWGQSTSLVNPVLSDSMLSVITNVSTELIKGLSDEVANKTKAALQRAVLGGQTPFQAMKQVSQVVGERGTSGAFYSAERIVRTEMGRAYNAADKLMGDQIADSRNKNMPALKKVWIATIDNRTREDHLKANKQVVDYDEPFIVGGEEIDWPIVDPNASPSNTINCRCSAIVVPEDLLDETLKQFP